MYKKLNQYRNNRKFVKIYVQIGIKLLITTNYYTLQKILCYANQKKIDRVGDRGIPSTVAMPNLSTT